MGFQFSKSLISKNSIQIICILILINILIISNFTNISGTKGNDLEYLEYNYSMPDNHSIKSEYNIDSEINPISESNAILWNYDIDVTSDSLELIPVLDRTPFQKCFNKIKFNIREIQNNSMERTLSSSQKNCDTPIQIFDYDLKLESIGSSNKIRTLNLDMVDLQHIFETTINQKANSISGLKQTVSLSNPSTDTKYYQASFIVESSYDLIKWNNQILELTSEPYIFDIPPNAITFIDEMSHAKGYFNWEDLIQTGFSPVTVGYVKDGISIIECTISFFIEAQDTVKLDPSYILENVADLRLFHEEEDSQMGSEIAVGDFNNDGYDDLVFAAPNVWSGPRDQRFRTGEVYIVYGRPGQHFGNYMNFSFSEDVVIYGPSEENNLNEASLAVGDINNDSYDDLVIGAPWAGEERGHVYVIFGNNSLKSSYDLDVTGDYKIRILGPLKPSEGMTGAAVAVGDINGDGFGDIIASSPMASFDNDTPTQMDDRDYCGMIYVIFGNTSMPNSYRFSLDQYDLRIYGEDIEDYMGQSLATGDINHDGIDDLVFGSIEMDAGIDRQRNKAGYVNVIFGNKTFPREWDMRHYENISKTVMGMLNSSITIMGEENDKIGYSLEVADINNDEFDDIIIGSPETRGKSGTGTDVGEVYVIYGDIEKNMLELMDALNMTRDGYVMYGKDSGDLFGWALAADDVNGDEINDIIIGAPGARGVSDDADRTGETYVIYGSNQKKHGYMDDLISASNVNIFYGSTKGELVGDSVASGDLDNDGKSEIIIGVSESNSLNGSALGVGRIDIIFNLTTSEQQISHTHFELLDGGGDNGTICYAGNEHTFRVRVYNSQGIYNINFTQLNLEPLGPSIKFKWHQKNNTFTEISDQFNYGSLNSSACVSRRITNTIYELDFKVILNFRYPSHKLSSCQLFTLGYNKSVPAAVDSYDDIYFVENQLKLIGQLKVRGNYQGVLKIGDRVHSGEIITWTGLKVVFNGTSDIYPGDEYFDVSVWDDDGDSWSDKFSSGEEILIESIADDQDDISDIHTINITNIAGNGKGLSVYKFEIRVEDTKISFTKPTPAENIWHNTLSINCGITISDAAGWQINGSSIEYSISTSGPISENFGSWINAGKTGSQDSYTTTVTVQFSNGDNNYIRWRAKNVASQIYGGSEPFRIRIDIEPVFYLLPSPDKTTWQYQDTVKCSITIIDNLSGVNKDSIQYRYRSSEMSTYEAWTVNGLVFSDAVVNLYFNELGKSKNVTGFRCSVDLKLASGTNNFIQWRAEDVLANSGLFSNEYQIRITTQKPITILTYPEDGATIRSPAVTLKWSGIDPNDDPILYDIYFSSEYSQVKNLDNSAKFSEEIFEDMLNITELENGGKYYWTVIPYDANEIGECQSDVWSFTVHLPSPIAKLTLPSNGSILNTTAIELLWDIEYIGIEQVKFDIFLDTAYPPTTKIAQDLTNNNYTYNGLENGKTYYWSVLPNVETILGEIIGQSVPGFMEFSINQDITPPAVILKQPINNLKVNTRQPELLWELIYDGPSDNITYTILLDLREKPAHILASGLMITNYTPALPLQFDKTYYWQVIPKLGNIEGVCLSGVWSFKTTSSLPEFSIQFNLDSDQNNFKLHPGDELKLGFNVWNLASVFDIINISIASNQFNIQYIDVTPKTFELSSGLTGNGLITILIPNSIELKTYNVTIIAISEGAAGYGLDVKDEKEITLIISKKEKTDDESMNINLIITLAFIILVFIILLIAITKKSFSKKEISIKDEEDKKKNEQKSEKVKTKKKPIHKKNDEKEPVKEKK